MSEWKTGNNELSLDKYRELADFHHQIREYIGGISESAKHMGSEPETYELLLAIEGLPEAIPPTFAEIAARMRMPRDSVVSLIEQAVSNGEVTNSPAGGGWVKLTRTGREVLRSLALADCDQLAHRGSGLLRPLHALLKGKGTPFRLQRRLPDENGDLQHSHAGV
jgi:hypothetical protein